MKSFRHEFVLCVLFFATGAGNVCAWSESGHHIIALMAFDLLTDQEQQQLLTLLAHHPRYREDFSPPEFLKDDREIQRWRIGRAGYWPDVARSQPDYDRPTWHYELGATIIVGDASRVRVPGATGLLSPSATLKSQALYIAQAAVLCQQVMSNSKIEIGDRALGCSWLAHLVADAHQPCHAGSLYAENLFPDGDRGANSIPIQQGQNLHFTWDALLGNRFDAGDVRRRVFEITSDAELVALGREAGKGPGAKDPQTWLTESRRLAIEYVYSPEVLAGVSVAARGLTAKVEPIILSEVYLRRAGRVAQRRAVQAAQRLAAVWRAALTVGG